MVVGRADDMEKPVFLHQEIDDNILLTIQIKLLKKNHRFCFLSGSDREQFTICLPIRQQKGSKAHRKRQVVWFPQNNS